MNRDDRSVSEVALWQRPSLGVGFLAASVSGLAILLYWAGVVTLPYSLAVLGPLSALAILAALALSGRTREDVFVDRLIGGLIAGAIGLVAYDLSRLVILLSGVAPFNPFRPIEVYGLLILNVEQDTTLTKAVGWGFHIWNGLSFATMYTMAVGRGKVWWALVWAMALEIAILVTYPSLFRLVIGWPFVTVSLVGHLFYGWAVGEAARRVVRS